MDPAALISTSYCPPQDYLLNGGNLAGLQERWHIEARRHGKYPNLVQLKYSQLESPLDVELVQECRGIILDEEDSWKVVAWPFKKFFNYGEPEAAPIDWMTAKVQEKLDGSMMIMYWYDGGWQVATSGMPDAAGEVQGTNKCYAELFWETWHQQRWPLPVTMSKIYTFMFELMTPYNRVVVKHDKSQLSLTGIRSVWTGKEVPSRLRSTYNPVREFELQSLDDILGTFKGMDPLEQEGYVIVDAAFNRVKVKHPGYVALHHLRSSFSARKLVDAIRRGETAELLAYFPEWESTIRGVQAAYDALVVQLEQDYEEIKIVESRRDFADMAKESIWPPGHFMLRDGTIKSIKEGLKDTHIDKMMQLLGVSTLKIEAPV